MSYYALFQRWLLLSQLPGFWAGPLRICDLLLPTAPRGGGVGAGVREPAGVLAHVVLEVRAWCGVERTFGETAGQLAARDRLHALVSPSRLSRCGERRSFGEDVDRLSRDRRRAAEEVEGTFTFAESETVEIAETRQLGQGLSLRHAGHIVEVDFRQLDDGSRTLDSHAVLPRWVVQVRSSVSNHR